MKRFISALLALTMVLAFCSVAAFAADGVGVTFGLAENPTIGGAVSDANNIKVGDYFEVAVKLSNVVGGFNSAQVIVEWDPTKVEVVKADGTKATAKNSAHNPNVTLLPKQDDEEETVFNWVDATIFEPDKGSFNITAYLSNGRPETPTGYDLGGTTNFDFTTIRFKALAEGDTGLKITKYIVSVNGGEFADVTYTPVTYTVKTAEPGPTEPTTKNVTNIDFPEIKTEYTQGDDFVPYEALKAKVTVDGAVEEMPITWTPNTVDTAVVGDTTVTAEVQIPADTAEVVYKLAAGVEKTKTYTVKVAEQSVTPPEDKVIETVDNPEDIDAYVGDEVTLPETVVGHVEGGETVNVPVEWGAVNTKTAGTKTVNGTLTAPDGYVLKRGLKATVKVNVTKKPAVPTIEALPDLENLLPKTVYVGDDYALPATVKATVDGKDAELNLIWDPATLDTTAEGTKVLTVKVDTTGYEVAKDVVTEATLSVEIIPVPELPVTPEVTVAPDENGANQLVIKADLTDENFINNLPVAPTDEMMVYFAYTFMDEGAPIEGKADHQGVTWGTIRTKAGNEVLYSTKNIPEGTTGIWVTPIYQFDPEQPIGADNLGTAVGKGVFVPVN